MVRCCSCMNEYSEAYDVCPHCGYVKGSQGIGMFYLPEGTLLLERYEVGIQINAGGFGIIYKAWDRTFDKMVAVKEYYPGGMAARTPGTKTVLIYSEKHKEEFQDGKRRFLIEARTMAKFNTHPNMANVYDFFEDNNTAYMIMDYMEGMSYKEYINSHNGIVDINTAKQVTLAVLDALKEVHKDRIVHRDINPANIFICNNGVIKLFDFGASRIENTDMTTILTPHYAPPEQYRTNSRQGAYTDIYALGATLYYAVTGVKPEESIDRVLEDNLKEPSQLNQEIPEYLNNAIMRAMAVKEELRFQNTSQFRDALMDRGKVLNIAEVVQKRKKQRVIGVSAAIAVLAVIAGTCFRVMDTRRENVYLENVTLEAWIPSEEGQNPEEMKAVFESMITEFKEDYPKVSITVTAIDGDDYEKMINEAAKSGDLPDIFDSTGLEEQYFDRLDSLEDAYELIEEEQFFFLTNYEKNFQDMKQMPLCFQVPVLYSSSVAEGIEAPASFYTCEALKVNDEYAYSINSDDFQIYESITNEDCVNWYKSLSDKSGQDFLTDGYRMFVDQSVSYYLSDTSDYKRMIDDIPGQFQVTLAGRAPYVGRFDHLFSVALSESEKTQIAAKRLVYYLLSEYAQDVLCIQNAAGFPVNRRMCEEYIKINQQDFEKIESYIPDIVFQEGDQDMPYTEYMKKWKN